MCSPGLINFHVPRDTNQLCRDIIENPNLYGGKSNLDQLNKILFVSLAILTVTVSLAIGQHHYFPLNRSIETAILMLALTPLPIAIVAEGSREFETLRVEITSVN
ncbi:MAG: hypothetical protein KFB93_06695 [Simkaniaceae bacterium]|nr:MAG: hypothetical protein KFB93_06695 [Simkaniaceae bacterium]